MTRFIQDRSTGKLVQVTKSLSGKPRAPAIIPDLEPFRSPVDGTLIGSKSTLRKHQDAHNVRQHQEYGENNGAAHFQRQERARMDRVNGNTREQKTERLNAVRHALDHHKG